MSSRRRYLLDGSRDLLSEFLENWALYLTQPRRKEDDKIARNTLKTTAENAVLAWKTQLMSRDVKTSDYLTIEFHEKLDRLIDSITEKHDRARIYDHDHLFEIPSYVLTFLSH